MLISPRAKRLLAIIVIVAALGGAWWYLRPKLTTAAASARVANLELGKQIKQATVLQERLEIEIRKAREQLIAAVKQADDLKNVAQADREKIVAAEKFIADLSERLETARVANEPMRVRMEAALTEGNQSKQELVVERGLAAEGMRELCLVKEQRQQLEQHRGQLEQANKELEKTLRQERQMAQRLNGLLVVLELGEQSPAAAAAGASCRPAEMPISLRECAQLMGQPDMNFQRGREIQLKWKQYTGRAVDGVLVELNDQPATRAALLKLAPARSSWSLKNGPWRVGQGEKVLFADLTALYGPPLRLSGMGDSFTATWCVGAWAREATARVVGGVVTEFDGRPADPAVCCELVRHRAAAHLNVDEKLKTDLAVLRQAYDAAVRAVGEELSRESAQRAKQSESLRQWQVAPFDSVGCWAAVTAQAGTYTVRAAVDTVYVRGDGQTLAQRRFVIVTVSPGSQTAPVGELALFAPGS